MASRRIAATPPRITTPRRTTNQKKTLDELTRGSDRIDRYYGDGSVELAIELHRRGLLERVRPSRRYPPARSKDGYRPFERLVTQRLRRASGIYGVEPGDQEVGKAARTKMGGLLSSLASGASRPKGERAAHEGGRMPMHRRPAALLRTDRPRQGLTITFVSLGTGGVASITAAAGLDLMTLASLTTANFIDDGRDPDRILHDPRRPASLTRIVEHAGPGKDQPVPHPPRRDSELAGSSPTNRLSHSIRRTTGSGRRVPRRRPGRCHLGLRAVAVFFPALSSACPARLERAVLATATPTKASAARETKKVDT